MALKVWKRPESPSGEEQPHPQHMSRNTDIEVVPLCFPLPIALLNNKIMLINSLIYALNESGYSGFQNSGECASTAVRSLESLSAEAGLAVRR